MSKAHLLVEKAFTYDRKAATEDPKGCRYDELVGAWLLGNERQFLVKSTGTGRPEPQSKKADWETGEDLKGS
jgi:hypothetical protein